MRIVSSHSGIEILDVDACQRLLSQREVGRIAVVVGRVPVILPVNYALDGGAIVLRTMTGSQLDRGQGPASFEIDEFDPATRSGWSVVVTGNLEELTPLHGDWQRVSALTVEPWAAGRREEWLRLRPTRVTGRVVRPIPGGDRR